MAVSVVWVVERGIGREIQAFTAFVGVLCYLGGSRQSDTVHVYAHAMEGSGVRVFKSF